VKKGPLLRLDETAAKERGTERKHDKEKKMNRTYLIILAGNHCPITHLVANAIRRLIRINIRPVIVHNRRAGTRRPNLLGGTGLVIRG
jgi:hypothetical protein